MTALPASCLGGEASRAGIVPQGFVDCTPSRPSARGGPGVTPQRAGVLGGAPGPRAGHRCTSCPQQVAFCDLIFGGGPGQSARIPDPGRSEVARGHGVSPGRFGLPPGLGAAVRGSPGFRASRSGARQGGGRRPPPLRGSCGMAHTLAPYLDLSLPSLLGCLAAWLLGCLLACLPACLAWSGMGKN